MKRFLFLLVIFSAVNIYGQNTNVFRSLYEAMERGDIESVSNIISDGFNISNNGWLRDAVNNCNNARFGYYEGEKLNDYIEIVRILLEAGADPNVKLGALEFIIDYCNASYHMRNNITHLMFSRVSEVSELLLNYGAKINGQDDISRTALMIASYFYNINNTVLKLLLENGADVNLRNHTGQTALHFAVYRLNIDGVRLLINHGADIHIRDNKGWSPLLLLYLIYGVILENEKVSEIAQILQNAGAILNSEDMYIINELRKDFTWWDEEI
jgi:ankyrin repeat protein